MLLRLLVQHRSCRRRRFGPFAGHPIRQRSAPRRRPRPGCCCPTDPARRLRCCCRIQQRPLLLWRRWHQAARRLLPALALQARSSGNSGRWPSLAHLARSGGTRGSLRRRPRHTTSMALRPPSKVGRSLATSTLPMRQRVASFACSNVLVGSCHPAGAARVALPPPCSVWLMTCRALPSRRRHCSTLGHRRTVVQAEPSHLNLRGTAASSSTSCPVPGLAQT